MKDIVFCIAVLCLFSLSVFGWMMNIIKLTAILGGDLTAMVAARLTGVLVPPLGVILGLFV